MRKKKNQNKDISNIIVTPNGIVTDITDGHEIKCPTCKGNGRLPDPAYFGKPIGYYHPNGDTFPHIPCRTCNGSGWVYKRLT